MPKNTAISRHFSSHRPCGRREAERTQLTDLLFGTSVRTIETSQHDQSASVLKRRFFNRPPPYCRRPIDTLMTASDGRQVTTRHGWYGSSIRTIIKSPH